MNLAARVRLQLLDVRSNKIVKQVISALGLPVPMCQRIVLHCPVLLSHAQRLQEKAVPCTTAYVDALLALSVATYRLPFLENVPCALTNFIALERSHHSVEYVGSVISVQMEHHLLQNFLVQQVRCITTSAYTTVLSNYIIHFSFHLRLAGTYMPWMNATSQNDCIDAPPGYWAAAGRCEIHATDDNR